MDWNIRKAALKDVDAITGLRTIPNLVLLRTKEEKM